MKQALFAGMAVVDMAILYGAIALCGFKPSPVAVVVIVGACYCAFQIYSAHVQQKAINAFAKSVISEVNKQDEQE
jgi:hypothetical protein